MQKVYWKADGTPDFGIPVADGVTPKRFSSYNYPDRFIRHWDYRARIEANVSPLADSQFRVVAGLTGTATVSLEAANFPGYYLRQKNSEVWLEKNDGTSTFASDATSTTVPGSPTPQGSVRVVHQRGPLHPPLQLPAVRADAEHGDRPGGRDVLRPVRRPPSRARARHSPR